MPTPTKRPDLLPSSLSKPNLPAILKGANLASDFEERLRIWIKEFDASLDQEHEVGVRLVNFGTTITFYLESISYWNPSLIAFSGTTTDGEKVELIQHVTQISILLMKLRKPDPEKPKRKIGFQSEET